MSRKKRRTALSPRTASWSASWTRASNPWVPAFSTFGHRIYPMSHEDMLQLFECERVAIGRTRPVDRPPLEIKKLELAPKNMPRRRITRSMATDAPPQPPASFRRGIAPEAPATAAPLRAGLLIFGIFVGLCGFWLLAPELLRPKLIGLPHDKASAAALGALQPRALLAARIGAIRGELWTQAAFAEFEPHLARPRRCARPGQCRAARTRAIRRRESSRLVADQRRGLVVPGEPSDGAAERRRRRPASRNVLFHRPQRLEPLGFAPRTRSRLRRPRGQGHSRLRQERYSPHLDLSAAAEAGHRGGLSQCLAAKSSPSPKPRRGCRSAIRAKLAPRTVKMTRWPARGRCASVVETRVAAGERRRAIRSSEPPARRPAAFSNPRLGSTPA